MEKLDNRLFVLPRGTVVRILGTSLPRSVAAVDLVRSTMVGCVHLGGFNETENQWGRRCAL